MAEGELIAGRKSRPDQVKRSTCRSGGYRWGQSRACRPTGRFIARQLKVDCAHSFPSSLDRSAHALRNQGATTGAGGVCTRGSSRDGGPSVRSLALPGRHLPRAGCRRSRLADRASPRRDLISNIDSRKATIAPPRRMVERALCRPVPRVAASPRHTWARRLLRPPKHRIKVHPVAGWNNRPGGKTGGRSETAGAKWPNGAISLRGVCGLRALPRWIIAQSETKWPYLVTSLGKRRAQPPGIQIAPGRTRTISGLARDARFLVHPAGRQRGCEKPLADSCPCRPRRRANLRVRISRTANPQSESLSVSQLLMSHEGDFS